MPKDPLTLQLQYELYHATVNSVDDNESDETSNIYRGWSSVNQPKQLSRKRYTKHQATATPSSSLPSMTTPAQSNSTSAVLNLSDDESRRLRKRSRPMNDNIIKQSHAKTTLPSRRRSPSLLYNAVQTSLQIARSPLFVSLCFVLALLYLIARCKAHPAETLDTTRSARIAICSCFNSTWRNAGAWMGLAWNKVAPAISQTVSPGTDLAISTVNRTNVAGYARYLGWLMLPNLGLTWRYPAPCQPLDSPAGNSLNLSSLGLGGSANNPVEVMPNRSQLTFVEVWLREKSYTISESDLIDKVELAAHYRNYASQMETVANEFSALVSETDAHVSFQKFNLAFLQGQLEEDDARIWWSRLVYSKDSYIRYQQLEFIHAAELGLDRLEKLSLKCVDLIRKCQNTDGEIQRILQRNRDAICEEVNNRSFHYRWRRMNRDLTQRTTTITNLTEYSTAILHLLGAILDKELVPILDREREVQVALSTLEDVLKQDHIGIISPKLKAQLQAISSSTTGLERARDSLRR